MSQEIRPYVPTKPSKIKKSKVELGLKPSEHKIKPNVRFALKHYFSKFEGTFAVFLSAGLDSHAVLFSLLELGRKVVIYSITVKGHESRDFKAARNTAEVFNLKFVPVYLPTKPKDIKKSLRYTVDVMKASGKVCIEALWTYSHAIHLVKEDYIASGLAADIYFVLSKKGCMHYKDKADEYRIPKWESIRGPNSQTTRLKNYCKTRGIRWLSPWLTQQMMDEFYTTSWDDVNKPKQKQPIRTQFEKELAQVRTYQHTDMHKGDSGISTLLSTLLNDPVWNQWGYKSMTGVYNRLVKGEIPNG